MIVAGHRRFVVSGRVRGFVVSPAGLAADGEFEEGKHPRGEGGKFGSGSGGGSPAAASMSSGKVPLDMNDPKQAALAHGLLREAAANKKEPDALTPAEKAHGEALAKARAKYAVHMKRTHEAAKTATGAAKKDFQKANAYYNAAAIQEAEGDHDSAEEALQEAREAEKQAKAKENAPSTVVAKGTGKAPVNPAVVKGLSPERSKRFDLDTKEADRKISEFQSAHAKRTGQAISRQQAASMLKSPKKGFFDEAHDWAFDRDSVRHIDDNGRLRVEQANISKANVCPYVGKEIIGWEELGLDPKKVYQLFRDPAALKAGAKSFNAVPILDTHVPSTAWDHPAGKVIGTTGTDAVFEAPYLKNSLVFWTQDAIDDIESRERQELSCGYKYRPIMEPGDYEGVKYDGRMVDILGNHVALVAAGRAGPDVIVGDSQLQLKEQV